LPFGVVHLLQVAIIADRFDALLQGDYLIVAGHHDHCTELQSLRQRHGADRHMVMLRRHAIIQNVKGQVSQTKGFLGPTDLRFGTHKHTDLVWQSAGAHPFGKPTSDDGDFFVGTVENLNSRRRAVEHRYGIAAIFRVAIYVGY